MTKQEALDATKNFSKQFPIEALQEIKASRENFIPELLESLDYAYLNAKELCERGNEYFLHMYAMFLLAEFREKRAFPLLIKLLHLPDDELTTVLGDTLTENYPCILISTFDDEKIQLLLDVIENPELDEWARHSAVKTYALLLNEGIIEKKECVSYLRSLIYEKLPSDDSDVVFTVIVDFVIDTQLIEMIPDVRFLYDDNRVDLSMNGKYDSFLDQIFSEKCSKPSYIDDAISAMKWWACFDQAPGENSQFNAGSIEDIFEKLQKSIKQEIMLEQKPMKVGRNDPCPCGSGKKYKKCCINIQQSSTTQHSSTTQQGSTIQQSSTTLDHLEDRSDFLKTYPKDSEIFNKMYDKESIDIDILAYKALHHVAVPLWIKSDLEHERIVKINLLNEALTLFIEKCQREQITSFSAYDERYMIHYRSSEWVSALIKLIEDGERTKFTDINQRAKDALQKFS